MHKSINCLYRKVVFTLLLPLGMAYGLAAAAVAQEAEVQAFSVKYANNVEDDYFKRRDLYFIELLKLVVKFADANIVMEPVPTGNQVESRIVLSVEQGVLDIHWLHTNAQLETQLLPIRIPLYKGLIGWRLMLVRKEDENLLKGISSVEGLRQYPLLQGLDWPDTPILQASGFNVESSTDFRNLFRMLRHERADLFPRSIIEIWGELDSLPSLNLTVDPFLTLHYPTAYYFFVAKDNKKLRDALELGLRRAIASGAFEQHFQSYFSEVIKKANLGNRNLISIKNPNLPPLTPLLQKDLWFAP